MCCVRSVPTPQPPQRQSQKTSSSSPLSCSLKFRANECGGDRRRRHTVCTKSAEREEKNERATNQVHAGEQVLWAAAAAGRGHIDTDTLLFRPRDRVTVSRWTFGCANCQRQTSAVSRCMFSDRMHRPCSPRNTTTINLRKRAEEGTTVCLCTPARSFVVNISLRRVSIVHSDIGPTFSCTTCEFGIVLEANKKLANNAKQNISRKCV
jgi:hypothetical protein